jgi:hypothetical protein
MDDPIAKMYWWKWWICWVMFKLKSSILFLNGRSWDTTFRGNTLGKIEPSSGSTVASKRFDGVDRSYGELGQMRLQKQNPRWIAMTPHGQIEN